jgi:hypothetical protein
MRLGGDLRSAVLRCRRASHITSIVCFYAQLQQPLVRCHKDGAPIQNIDSPWVTSHGFSNGFSFLIKALAPLINR